MKDYHWIALAIVLVIFVGWYWSVRIDRQIDEEAKRLKQFPTDAHHGDLFVKDGKCYMFTGLKWVEVVQDPPSYEMMRRRIIELEQRLLSKGYDV